MAERAGRWRSAAAGLAIAAACGCAASPADRPVETEPYWRLSNVDASPERVAAVQEILARCSRELSRFFPKRPLPLTVYTCDSRETFVITLRARLGFHENTAEYFRTGSAPRPMSGKMAIPQDQSTRNICHELVHHHLESNTSRDNLLSIKWLDEGLATHLADLIEPGSKTPPLRKADVLPLEAVSSEVAWHQLHRDPATRSRPYLQAEAMVRHLLQRHSPAVLTDLLRGLQTQSPDDAFRDATGETLQQFFDGWIASLPPGEVP